MPDQHPGSTDTTHVVFILDSSGSMGSIRDEAIELFNAQVSEVRAATQNGRSTVSFATFGTESRPIIHYVGQDITRLEPLTHATYRPNGQTPMLDAIGWMVECVEQELVNSAVDYSVLVIIVSDGQENYSGQWQHTVSAEARHRTYTAEEIQTNVTRLESTGCWTFTFLGANLDLRRIVNQYGFQERNVSAFTSSKEGMAQAQQRLSESSRRYMEKKKQGLRRSRDFFGDPDEAMAPQGGPATPPAGGRIQNSINVIKPYLWNGVWVFDDPARGLDKEALVSGVPEIIEAVCAEKGIRDPQNGFVVIFSASPFPGADVVLEHLRPDENGSGNWYRLRGTSMEGWLCPALLKYFDSAPPRIYIQVKSAQ